MAIRASTSDVYNVLHVRRRARAALDEKGANVIEKVYARGDVGAGERSRGPEPRGWETGVGAEGAQRERDVM